MTRPYIELLMEDATTKRFFTALLVGRNGLGCTSNDQSHFSSWCSPSAKGDAKQAVLGELRRRLFGWSVRRNAHRRAGAFLLVIVDADNLDVAEREAQVLAVVQETLKLPSTPTVDQCMQSHGIVVLVPKWEIETWILSLAGEGGCESEQASDADKRRCAEVKRLYHAAERLVARMRQQSAFDLPSLGIAVQRLRSACELTTSG